MKVIVSQAIKHLLTGAFATVVDICIFWILSFIFFTLASKTLSFIVAMVIKYAGNKYWAFGGPGDYPEKDGIKRELIFFMLVMAVGTIIDVGAFYIFANILGIFATISIIFAAAVAAIWNFLGYKFLVFKK